MDVCGIYTEEALAKWKHPYYKTEEARKESFDNASTMLASKINSMVTAGFFYTGSEDIVSCYSCGLSMGGWETRDDPLSFHLFNSNSCKHIRSVKTNGMITTSLYLLFFMFPYCVMDNFSVTINIALIATIAFVLNFLIKMSDVYNLCKELK